MKQARPLRDEKGNQQTILARGSSFSNSFQTNVDLYKCQTLAKHMYKSLNPMKYTVYTWAGISSTPLPDIQHI